MCSQYDGENYEKTSNSMGKWNNKGLGNKHPKQDNWNQDKGQREEDRPHVWTKYDSAATEEFLQGI